MRTVRQEIGGLGNLMFKQAFLLGKLLDGEIPDVYLQSTKYWKQHEDAIKATFSSGIERNPYISLHIRRGDYVNNPFYVDLTKTQYYQQAIKHFPGEKFLIFCKDNQGRDMEDREWVINFVRFELRIKVKDFDLAPLKYSETDDLNLMAGCKGHIMANSSFSWWGSYLGGGETVCPANWFTDGVQRTELLDEWKKI